jgi:hypothetical protein
MQSSSLVVYGVYVCVRGRERERETEREREREREREHGQLFRCDLLSSDKTGVLFVEMKLL